ncbi:hypothetical protein G7Y89_g7052 [Cudoniella acicularis]|uniref:Uncharacterized protein n=1 Tax=Cudoniella acicularis TaxID=354080 RepID=A0A8H4RJB6_9HELO|nr:hypothetical protein G7Y89_g7052 [Cudoniella acicularis]
MRPNTVTVDHEYPRAEGAVNVNPLMQAPAITVRVAAFQVLRRFISFSAVAPEPIDRRQLAIPVYKTPSKIRSTLEDASSVLSDHSRKSFGEMPFDLQTTA